MHSNHDTCLEYKINIYEKGAKLNIRDENEETPIDFAISNGNSNNDETILFLRKHGAKTSEKLKAEDK